MAPVDIRGVPAEKRAQIERWVAQCRAANLSEDDYAYVLDATTTREEMVAFMSPFDCAEELADRVLRLHPGVIPSAMPDDATLIAALRESVDELAANAQLAGAQELAERARAVPEFRAVGEIERPWDGRWLGADIDLEISDAIRRDLRGQGDDAASNLDRVVKEWMPTPTMAAYVVLPLVSLDLRLDAFQRVHALGAECKVTEEVALVALRWPAASTGWGEDPVGGRTDRQ